VTEPDPAEPVQPGGEARGVGESLDAPSADVPAVDDLPPGERPIGQNPAELRPVPPAGSEPTVVEVTVPAATVDDAIVDDAEPRRLALRRAPRYRAFIGTGVVLGAVIAVLLTALFPDDGRFSTGSVMGYLGVVLALVGGLLGGAAAVLVERPRRR